eukprot:scaffold93977_cov62-Attheya_sp.AAC.3
MGIKDLLPKLPVSGGDIALKPFASISSLRDKVIPVDFDTGSLVYVCVIRHKVVFKDGDYLPAVSEFHKVIIAPIFLYKWHLLLIFDGVPPEEKRFEHMRQKKSGGLTLTSLYIAMLTKLCERYQIPSDLYRHKRPTCRLEDHGKELQY